VAKRLIGSGCRLGDEWSRSRDGCITVLDGVHLGGDALFPDYLGKDLLLIVCKACEEY